MNSVKIHTTKDSIWTNSMNEKVPFKFVPATDKTKEALAGKILKSALGIEATLQAFHEMIHVAFMDISAAMKAEYELKYKKEKKWKGSLTWFNFDRSIKIEADMNEIVKWDQALMTEAKSLFDNYISSNMSEANELIADLVKSAFGNSKGMIDTGKVFQILKHEQNIKNKSFQKACELIKRASSIDKTKLYMRVWEKMETGEYRNVNLNFSSL